MDDNNDTFFDADFDMLDCGGDDDEDNGGGHMILYLLRVSKT